MKLDSLAYWRHRVQCLLNELAQAKRRRSPMTEEQAMLAAKIWVSQQSKIDPVTPEVLSADQCRRVVALLHRHRLVKR